MLRTEIQQDQVAELRHLADALATNLRVAAPGIIQSYDPETITAAVQIVGTESLRQSDGEFETVELPLLQDVPICWPGCRDFALTLPLQQGDEVLLIFQDRAMDSWWQSGGVQPQIESRMHDLSDAIAIPRIYSQIEKIPKPHPENLQIRTADGTSFIEMEPGGRIRIISTVEILMEAPHIGLND